MQKPQTHDPFVAPSPRYALSKQMSDNPVKVSNENKKLGRLAIAVAQHVFYRARGRLGLPAVGRHTRQSPNPSLPERDGAPAP